MATALLALVRVGEVLILVRRDLPAGEAEPSPQSYAHGFAPRRLVERARYASPPVDDDRVAVLIADMSSADVQRVVGRVDAPEEERGIRVVNE